jgi:tryptophan synthase alpha chain
VNRIAKRFEQLRMAKRKGLVTFITAGDPQIDSTLATMHALVEAGANIIELGVPFSDPMADGPVIQLANDRALANGVTMRDVFELVKRFRAGDADTPVVLMGYLNPIEAMGYERAAQGASDAGVDGFIVVDAPPEESSDLHAALCAQQLDLIFLIAPNTDEDRIRKISALGSGFVYYVSLKGVTGAGHLDVSAAQDKVTQIKSITDLPVAVGFGISDGPTAAQVAEVSDAVVVGSALINRIVERLDDSAGIAAHVGDLARTMRTAMDANTVDGAD